jgi:hypothetical protein
MAKVVARFQSVFNMLIKGIFVVNNAGNASLSILGVAFVKVSFSYNRNASAFVREPKRAG